MTISQSGETLDTMEALKYARQLGHRTALSICNVAESAIPRASDLVFYTRAGAEIHHHLATPRLQQQRQQLRAFVLHLDGAAREGVEPGQRGFAFDAQAPG